MIDLDKVYEVGMKWADLVDEAAEYDLRLRVQDVTHNFGGLRSAVQLLQDDVPLRTSYPNGDPAVPPFTVGQILLLASKKDFTPITHEDSRHHDVVVEVRGELGRRPPRLCGGNTRRGDSCRAYALPYAEMGSCWNHSTPSERAYNDRMLKREKDLVNARLRQLD